MILSFHSVHLGALTIIVLLLTLLVLSLGVLLHQHSSIGWHALASVGWVTAPL